VDQTTLDHSYVEGRRVDKDKRDKAEKTVANLRDRWGARVVGRLGSGRVAGFPHLPTGFPALDKALTIGGLPRGRISEISGVPTSGMATVALKIIAQDQSQSSAGGAIYIDPAHTFDPEYAVRCGLELSQLILVRPYDMEQALTILADFILSGGVSCLVFDAPASLLVESRPAQALSTSLGRLIATLSQSGCVLLFLTSLPAGSGSEMTKNVVFPTGSGLEMTKNAASPADSALSHYASIRLHIQRERWIYRQRDIRGYQAQVAVVKNKLGPAGQEATIEIIFDDEFEDKP
jgi:recombination protein RecA